jgi:hypothetical protein
MGKDRENVALDEEFVDSRAALRGVLDGIGSEGPSTERWGGSDF